MKVLVTGSAGHLGEALVRTLKDLKYEVTSLDILKSPFTSNIGSIVDREFVRSCVQGVKIIYHTATLHKPHIATHTIQDFIDTNITGTLNLLEEAVAAGVDSFIFTSTTSVFGDVLIPPPGEPAAWITEKVIPVPKNIYGVTKTSAEDFCQLFFRNHNLPCIILRTSRFFPEEDDNKSLREIYSSDNSKANEYLFRRVDIEDAVTAHILAARHAKNIGFGKYVISATTPFQPGDLSDLRSNAPAVVKKIYPEYETIYRQLNWRMFPEIDRVYDNASARKDIGWEPKHNFRQILDRLKNREYFQSHLTQAIGSKGYHAEKFSSGPYPVQ